jgi:hypothetical protein
MNYTIDERGILLYIDEIRADEWSPKTITAKPPVLEADFTRPIPDADAVETVKHVAAHANGYECECAACRKKRAQCTTI